MLTTIKKFFDERIKASDQDSELDTQTRMALATAALLVELMKSDSHIDKREKETLRQVLSVSFNIEQSALDDIVALAEQQSHEASSLYEFTALINQQYSYQQRVELMESLWRVAFADSTIDKYEEHLIRKIADLIYVNHSDFIKAKLKVRDDA
jgi:uncharacterized tellurite resistance protein B-like protein